MRKMMNSLRVKANVLCAKTGCILSNKTGSSYIDQAVVILIAVVLGACCWRVCMHYSAMWCYPLWRKKLLRCSTMLVNRIAILAVFFIALLFWASVVDIRTRMLPDCLHVFVALTTFLVFEPGNLSGIFAALPLFLAAITCGGMGGGDIKLMAACGLVLGFCYGILAQIIGLSLLLVYYAIYYPVQRGRGRTIQKSFPLAPFLAIGCMVSYFIKLGG